MSAVRKLTEPTEKPGADDDAVGTEIDGGLLVMLVKKLLGADVDDRPEDGAGEVAVRTVDDAGCCGADA